MKSTKMPLATAITAMGPPCRLANTTVETPTLAAMPRDDTSRNFSSPINSERPRSLRLRNVSELLIR